MDVLASETLSSGFDVRSESEITQNPARASRQLGYLAWLGCAIILISDIISLFVVAPLISVAIIVLQSYPMVDSNHPVNFFVALWADILVISFLTGILIWTAGQYYERPSLLCETRCLTAACGIAALMVMLWPLPGVNFLSRVPIAVMWMILLPLWMLALRQVGRKVLSWAGHWRVPVVVVAEANAIDTIDRILNPRRPVDFDVVGILLPAAVIDWEDRDWRNFLRNSHADRVIIATPPGTPGHDQILKSIVRSRIPFTLVFDSGEMPVFGMHQTRALRSDAVLLSYRTGSSRSMMRLLKTAMDLCAAIVLLLIIAPALFILSALVALDGGPIIFSQERVGEHGKRFRCFKFRTMVANGDAVLQHTLATDPVAAKEWALSRKLSRDPRITRVGRFLRKSSLDELPQLFNILQLNMSLVGPRPIMQDEIALYAEDIVFYYESRPGLTGLWQVSGRSDTTYEQRVAYDRWYVKNWTLWHDFVILFMTVPVLMTRKGAR